MSCKRDIYLYQKSGNSCAPISFYSLLTTMVDETKRVPSIAQPSGNESAIMPHITDSMSYQEKCKEVVAVFQKAWDTSLEEIVRGSIPKNIGQGGLEKVLGIIQRNLLNDYFLKYVYPHKDLQKNVLLIKEHFFGKKTNSGLYETIARPVSKETLLENLKKKGAEYVYEVIVGKFRKPT